MADELDAKLDSVQEKIDEAKQAAGDIPERRDGGADQDDLHHTPDSAGEQTGDAAEATLDEFRSSDGERDEGMTEGGGGGQGAA